MRATFDAPPPTLWVPAPPPLADRVAGLLGTAAPALGARVRPLASLPDLPVIPLDALEEPSPVRPGGGRLAVRFPLSVHRLVTELAFRLLVERCAGATPPVVVLPVVPAAGENVEEVPPLPLAASLADARGGLELGTVNYRPGSCAAYVTEEALVVVPRSRRTPGETARLVVNHRRFRPDHCEGDRLLAEVAEWPTVPTELVDAALIVHELVTVAAELHHAGPVARVP